MLEVCKFFWRKGKRGELGLKEIIAIVIAVVVLVLLIVFVGIFRSKGFGDGGLLDSLKNALRGGAS